MNSVRKLAKAEIAQAIQDSSPPYIGHHTALDMAETVIDALQAAGYTIERDWQPIESAPRAKAITTPRDAGHVLAYWPDYEDGDGSFGGFYAESWFVPTSMRFVCYSSLMDAYWPNKWQPTHWKPLPSTPTGEA